MAIASVVFLVLLSLFSAMQGVTTLGTAQSAMHQIYGAVWWIVFSVSISGIGTISAVWEINRNAKTMADLNEKNDFKITE